eukprot:15581338-Heterocapsa_arctica.AAC.1
MRGKTKKLRESVPHSPCLPLSGPMVLSCWHGDPPMTRSMAPGSILASIVWMMALSFRSRSHTSAQARSKNGPFRAWLAAQWRAVGNASSSLISANHPPLRRSGWYVRKNVARATIAVPTPSNRDRRYSFFCRSSDISWAAAWPPG